MIARGGLDVTNYIETEFNNLWTFNPGSYAANEGASAENGTFDQYAVRSSQLDGNVFFNADYRIGTDWSIHGVLGLNANQRASQSLAGSLDGLSIDGWASFLRSTSAGEMRSI